jgi:hypothetical protein
MKKIIFFALLNITSCSNTNCDWKGGLIRDFGEYCTGELKVSVFEKSNDLKYEVRNSEGEIVIQQDMSISIYQHWGLFLDKKKNFWVFSSDVGTGIWERDKGTGRYNKRMFHHQLSKDEVPPEIYESWLKRFLKP